MLCLSFLAGVGLARIGSLGVIWCAGLGLPLALGWRRQTIMIVLLAAAFGLNLGWWRGSVYMQKLATYQSFIHQKVTIRARATEDAVYGRKSQLTFIADNVRVNDMPLTGKIELSGFGANSVLQGDEVVTDGSLYPGYGAYQGQMSFAKLQVVAHNPSMVNSIRRRFTAGMQTALPEPLAPFAMGLLIGQRATLPDSVKQDLLMVGLTHIIAVSGYNLTIILRASRRLLAGQSKRLSTMLSLGLIGVFLLLAGTSASIVRAAIVSMLSIFAGYYGRNFRPLNLLALAAATTVWANPFYLWSDVSWYLSFLAFFGVMVLSPLVQTRWPGHWHQTIIGGVALESVCAEAMSEPFILYIFGQMSFIGLPANVLVTTLVPLAMLLVTVAGLAGMFAAPIAGWLSWPATGLLNYMLDAAHLMARVPRIFIQNYGLPLWIMLGLYAAVLGLTFVLWRKTRPPKPATITDMNEPKAGGLTA